MTGDANRADYAGATALAGVLGDAFAGFAARLRWLGLDLSTVELTDSLRAIRGANLLDRNQLRRLLAITMVKRSADIPTFNAAFDLFFPASFPASGPRSDHESDRTGSAPTGRPGEAASTALLSRMVDALRGDSGAGLETLAAEAVTAFAGLDSLQLSGSERYYQYRVLRQLDVSALLLRAMRADAHDEPTVLEKRLSAIERQSRLEDLRSRIAAELRWRLADLGGVESALEQLRESVADVDFLRAGPAELAAMRAAVRPVARQLAAAARRRRRLHSSGRLHVRKTLRRAVAAGGVPLYPAWHERRRPRPQLIVLCDVSGSVAEFAKFTLSLLHALHAELPRLRSFVFADGVAEVTEQVESSPGVIDTRLLLSRPGVVRGDGHSDYGAVLQQFLELHGRELSSNCVLIVCGDARSNYRPARPDLLHVIRRRVRQLHWLNPEPRGQWDTGDSRLGEYRPDCDSVAEVRNLRQLSLWVDTLL